MLPIHSPVDPYRYPDKAPFIPEPASGFQVLSGGYLFPKMPHRPVSTLSVYLAKLMAEAGKLDPVVVPDLRKVIAKKPESFEAELAVAAIKALDKKKR